MNEMATVGAALYGTFLATPGFSYDGSEMGQTTTVKLTPELNAEFAYKPYGVTAEASVSGYFITAGSSPKVDDEGYALRDKSGFFGRLSLDKALTSTATMSVNGLVGSAKQYSVGMAVKFAGK